MAQKNKTGPKNTDRRQDQKPIATEPMHARIIPLFPDFEIFIQRHVRRGEIVRVVKALDLEVNLILLDSEIPKPQKNLQL